MLKTAHKLATSIQIRIILIKVDFTVSKQDNSESDVENNMIKISELQEGQSATVTDMRAASHAYRHRLYALGLREGVSFRLLQRAPFGDPMVIYYAGTSLCLRAKEADCLILKRCE